VGSLRTRGDIIAKLAFGSLPQQKEDVCIDADGAYLSPGFIDIHTHGAGGADFMDGDEESVYRA